MTDRRLTTAADILAAARWRLRAWAPERIAAGVARVAELQARGVPVEEARPDVAEALGAVADGREPWGALCALLVLHADAAGDVALLFVAGIEVLASQRQAQRAEGVRGGDALDGLIRSMLAELPADWPPTTLWAELAHRASTGSDPILCDYDSLADAITFEPRLRATPRTLMRSAFTRRLYRIKKIHPDHERRKPASVTSDQENALQIATTPATAS